MKNKFAGPFRNPFKAVLHVSGNDDEVKEAILGVLDMFDVDPRDDFLKELLADIAIDTGVVVRWYEGEGWFAALNVTDLPPH